MTASLTADHPIIRLTFYSNLFFLMLAIYGSDLTNAAVMLPWALTLICTDVRLSTIQMVRKNQALTAFSCILTCLILLGCQSHSCTYLGMQEAAIPILWLPIATLSFSIRGSHHRTALMAVLMTAICWISLLVIWQYLVENHERPKGLSHNVLTTPMLLAMLCMTGALFHLDGTKRLRLAFHTTFVLGIVASILTHSKTGLITFMVATGIHFTLLPKTRIKTLLLSTPIIIIWIFSLTEILERIPKEYAGYQNNQYKTSLAERSDAIKWSRRHFMDSPLLGKGPAQLTSELSHRWQEWGIKNSDVLPMPHLHNDYLQMTVAYGIPAAICFIAMWLLFISNTMSTTSDIQTPQATSKTCILMLIGIFMTAFMTDSFTHWNNAWAMTTACIGLCIGMLAKNHTTQNI